MNEVVMKQTRIINAVTFFILFIPFPESVYCLYLQFILHLKYIIGSLFKQLKNPIQISKKSANK